LKVSKSVAHIVRSFRKAESTTRETYELSQNNNCWQVGTPVRAKEEKF